MIAGAPPGAAPEVPRPQAVWVAAGLAAGGAAGLAAVVLPNPLLALVALAAVAVAAAVIVNPEWALYAIAAFAVLNLANVATDFYGAPSLFQPLLALAAIGIAYRWVSRARPPRGGGRAAAFILPYATVALASLLFASDLAVGRTALESLLKDAVVAVLVGLLLTRAVAVRGVVWILVAGGGLLATVSGFQFITGSFGSSYLGFGQSAVQTIVGAVNESRISGPIGDPNFYAQWLVMLFPLALDRAWGEHRLGLRVAAAYSAAAMAASVIFTFSRGGALALIAVVLLMLLRRPARWKTLAVLATAAVVSFPFLPSNYLARLTEIGQVGTVDSTTDPSIRGRTAEVAAGWEMFVDNPLTGVGIGNYTVRYEEYAHDLGIDDRRVVRQPHNLYLELAAETGLPGLAAFGVMLGGAFASLAAARRRFLVAGHQAQADTTYALGVALVAWLLTSAFLHLDFARPLWLLLGVAFALPRVAATEAEAVETARTAEVAA
jgi:putative inorganic carbon (HCO3(-)) transporter